MRLARRSFIYSSAVLRNRNEVLEASGKTAPTLFPFCPWLSVPVSILLISTSLLKSPWPVYPESCFVVTVITCWSMPSCHYFDYQAPPVIKKVRVGASLYMKHFISASLAVRALWVSTSNITTSVPTGRLNGSVVRLEISFQARFVHLACGCSKAELRSRSA